MKLRELQLLRSKNELDKLPQGKLLINTINAYSFITAKKDELFQKALLDGDVLIPDGISIVLACKMLQKDCKHIERIAGWDLFSFEMTKLENVARTSGTVKSVMFMGSSNNVLEAIVRKAAKKYPHLRIHTYSPPYKPEFTEEENNAMVNAINSCNPDLLWIGMTAPKQEKWTIQNWDKLNIHCHCGTIGAVFDFFAGTVRRAPEKWQKMGLEWLYRLINEPRRLWKRYIIGNLVFTYYAIKELI